jgi:hypothetical protein
MEIQIEDSDGRRNKVFGRQQSKGSAARRSATKARCDTHSSCGPSAGKKALFMRFRPNHGKILAKKTRNYALAMQSPLLRNSAALVLEL